MRKELRMLSLLAGLVLAFFWDTLTSGQVLAMRDAACTFMPMHQFLRQAFADGALPLWNQFANCGDPLLANPQYSTYYLPNLLYYVLPSSVLALKLWLVLHMLLPAWGFFGLLRHLQLSRAPAVLGAVSFTFSTYVVARMEFHSCFGALVWTPLLLLCSARLVARVRELRGAPLEAQLWGVVARAVPLAFVMALQFLAGYPQQLLFGLFLAFAYALARNLAWRSPGGAGRAWGALLLAGAAALLLGACQLLPSLELIPYSVRGGRFDPAASSASLHPRMLLSWLLPHFGGRPGYTGEWWGTRGFTVFEFWVGTGYVGILPLITASFAPFALSNPRRRFLVVFFSGATLVGLLLAMGQYTPAYGLIYEHAPLFDRLRFPSKSLVFVVVGLSALAALGLQELLEARPWTRGRRLLLGAWVGLLLVLLAGYPFVGPGTFEALTGGAFVHDPGRPDRYAGLLEDLRLLLVFLASALGTVCLLAWVSAPARARLAGLAIGVAFANLLLVSGRLHPRTDATVYTYQSARLASLVGEHSRVAPLYFHNGQQILYGSSTPGPFLLAREAGVGNTSLPLNVPKIKGGAGLLLWRYKLFSDPVYSLPHGDPSRDRILDLLAVTTELRGPPVSGLLGGGPLSQIWQQQRANPLPRAMLLQRWKVIADLDAAEEEILRPAFDPRTTVVLSEDPGIAQGTGPGEPVREIVTTWNRVNLRVRAEAPSVLLLNDTFFPGWEARVDGRTVPILRANAFFRGVALEPGQHQVSMVYDPWPAKLGLALTLLVLPLLLLLWWYVERGALRAPR